MEIKRGSKVKFKRFVILLSRFLLVPEAVANGEYKVIAIEGNMLTISIMGRRTEVKRHLMKLS